jgi:hypothetical protein
MNVASEVFSALSENVVPKVLLTVGLLVWSEHLTAIVPVQGCEGTADFVVNFYFVSEFLEILYIAN